MKIKFRTLLLVFLFIKLCILFTVLQETTESLSSDDHPLIYNTKDIYLFDLLLAIISSLSIAVSFLLIFFFAIGHNRIRKPYMIVAFAINLIFIAPFFISGIYFSFHDNRGLELSLKMKTSFAQIYNFVETFRQLNSTDNVTLTVSTDTMKAYDFVNHIQKRYCCCGLDGAEYYGFDNATTALKEQIRFTEKLFIRCPLNSNFKNSTCVDSHLHGCEDRITTVHPTRILMYSCIGTAFSILFLVLSPFIYSQFELDRRRARSEYIRKWRQAVEQHVNDHRMVALRSLRNQQSEKDAGNQVSPTAQPQEESQKVNENRSAPRF